METKILKNNTAEDKHETIDRKDFMRQVGIGFGAIVLMNCLQSCGESEIPDPNPGTGTGLDFELNLNQAANAALNSKGGFLVVSDKKVIIARTLSDSFIAVASVCTHEGTTIAYRSASNDFRCPNHGSEFTAAGAVQVGPAAAALTKYKTSFDATSNILRIFS